MTLRLMVADDQALVRSALAALLSLEPDFTVVAEVGRGDEVVAAARDSQPDVALLDIEMPGADGLDAAHRLGIVHRDLKPDNVLVIEGEHEDRVKVVDFGIAKAFGAGEGDGPALTRTGYVVGTPEFMSPEQLLGNPVDARSDVYALALVA